MNSPRKKRIATFERYRFSSGRFIPADGSGETGEWVVWSAAPSLLTKEFADAASRALQHADAVLIRNHGLVVAGPDLHGTLDLVEEVEECCRVYLVTGQKSKPIPEKFRKHALEWRRKRARGQTEPCGQ